MIRFPRPFGSASLRSRRGRRCPPLALEPLLVALGILLLGALAPAQSATSVHVASVETGPRIEVVGSGGRFDRYKIHGTAKVVIVDNLGNPVAGAIVSGVFSSDNSRKDLGASGTTGAAGSVVLTTPRAFQDPPASITFCVTGVSAALPYASGDNVMDCDTFTWPS